MAIIGNIELALMYLHPDHRSYTFLQNASEVSGDAKNLVHKFLLFSNFDPPSRKALALQELISTSCQGVLAGSKVLAEIDLPDTLWPVYADPGQLDQALREIVRNAAEASAAGAKMWISAANHPTNEDGRRQGPYVRLSIRDEGSGISKEDLPNIFDPYFSRKTRGIVKGMGLGLTIAAAIIHQHGGYIEVDSHLGEGTSVDVDIPAAIEEHKGSGFLS
jgi:signal transduction histidine kinase